MTFAIAAAGTGGHVFPALAVGQALVESGVPIDDVLYIGGDRLEAEVYPAAGFPFEAIEIRGLSRSSVRENLGLPGMLRRATRRAKELLVERKVGAVLGFGNYITVPVAWAGRRLGIPVFIHEQNAHPGLANRVASRWSVASFVSFPDTPKLRRVEVTGNPMRPAIARFDRAHLRPEAQAAYGLSQDRVTVGVFGGSLGAGAINEAITTTLETWDGVPIQVVHVAGRDHAADLRRRASQTPVPWIVLDFEERMELFFAASDLVVARAGGGIAEVLATGSPSILIPGGFGSGGHQTANAAYAADAGAAVVIPEPELSRLSAVMEDLAGDPTRRAAMSEAARGAARPDAARVIADRLREASHD